MPELSYPNKEFFENRSRIISNYNSPVFKISEKVLEIIKIYDPGLSEVFLISALKEKSVKLTQIDYFFEELENVTKFLIEEDAWDDEKEFDYVAFENIISRESAKIREWVSQFCPFVISSGFGAVIYFTEGTVWLQGDDWYNLEEKIENSEPFQQFIELDQYSVIVD